MQAAYDVVVVGSGFGGSVSALRVAEAGHSVLVLERGRHYAEHDFPRNMQDVHSILWQQSDRRNLQGLYDIRFFSDVGVACASGVGGGSLIYANIHIRPDKTVFDAPQWPDELNLNSLSPYYDMVASALNISPVVADLSLAKRDLFRQCADYLDVPVFDPDQAVSWEKCQHCTECEFGCRYGAKNTLDKNYLQRALDAGAELQSQALVTIIEPTFKGYYVHYRDLKNGDVKKQIKTRRVILAAGTLGTAELLFRNRDGYKTLGDISKTLGRGFSANGDFLGSVQNAGKLKDPWVGPDVTSVMKYDLEDSFFTLAAPTFNQQAQEVLASMGQREGRLLRFIGPIIWRFLPRLIPWAMEKGYLSEPMRRPGPNAGPASQFTNLFAIGRDNANGRLLFKRNKLDIEWDYYGENRLLVSRMLEVMKEIARYYEGSFSPLVSWNMAHKPFTVHPLGGCAMSDSIQTGVISATGEVHDYPGLYVSDGSMIPAAIGYHPVMTISAIAERNVEAMLAGL